MLYREVSQFMGSLNWASGLIPLGRLHMRPLQQHFHSLGLINWFTPPCLHHRVDQTLQSLPPSFLTSGIPIRPFRPDFTIFTEASTHTLLRLVVDLFLWLQNQNIALWARHIPGCLNVIADWLTWLNQPITTVESPPQNSEPNLRDVGNSSSGHVCHSPQHPSLSPVPKPRALAIDALSQDWQGRSMYMFPPFPPAQQSHSGAQDHPGGRSDTNTPWWP